MWVKLREKWQQYHLNKGQMNEALLVISGAFEGNRQDKYCYVENEDSSNQLAPILYDEKDDKAILQILKGSQLAQLALFIFEYSAADPYWRLFGLTTKKAEKTRPGSLTIGKIMPTSFSKANT